MALKIISVFVAFYAFAGLLGALQLTGLAHPGAARVLFAVALLLSALIGFPTAVWTWRRSLCATTGLRLFGLAWLLVAVLMPFQGRVDKLWNAVIAEVLGCTAWVLLILYVARYIDRRVRASAA